MNRHFLLTVFAAMLLMTLGSCGSKDQNAGQTDKANPQTVENTPSGNAPEVAANNATTQFAAMDLSGLSQNSSQWIGKVPVVINFWGTWCPPCRREIPDLVRLYDEFHQRGVEMIGLAVKDEPGDVSAFAEKQGMKWVMLMANDEVVQAYDIVNGIPTTVFLDKDGREVTRFIGNRSYEDFKPAFEAILKGYSR